MLVLLPCYSLEDFSLYRSSEEAKNIFSAISVFFHPALLDKFQKLPDWEPAGSPNQTIPYTVVLVPPCCENEVPASWLLEQEEKGTVLIRNCPDRESMLAEIFDQLAIKEHPFDRDFCDSFLALGLAWFISDLLTRKLRYMSDIDMTELGKHALAAIASYKNGNRSEAVDELQKGFDLVCEANEYYFPTPVKFLDLTRLDGDNEEDNLTAMLDKRAFRNEKTNLLLPLARLKQLREHFPDTFNLLKKEAQSGRINFISADPKEEPIYLLPQYAVLQRLRQGRNDYFELIGAAPDVFGRTAAGLTPALPRLLTLAGWKSGLLFTTDGWHLDFQMQSRVQWQGPDETVIPTLGQEPLDGEKDDIFMEQLDKLGYSYSSDEVMTAAFAHRPNRECDWFAEVERFNRFDPILGKIFTINEYFETTQSAGVTKTLNQDDFRTNFLTRNENPDPVSYWHNFFRNYAVERGENAFDLLPEQCQKNSGLIGITLTNCSLTTKSVFLDGSPENPDDTTKHLLHTFIDDESGASETIVTLPPMSRIWLKLNGPNSVKKEKNQEKTGFFKKFLKPIFSLDPDLDEDSNRLVGFKEERVSRTEVSKFYFLRNEYFELQVDPATGQMKKLQTFDGGSLEVRRGLLRQPGRGNRFAWQVAYRMSPDELESDSRSTKDGNYGYSIMTAEKIEIQENGPGQGSLAIRGKLMLPDGKCAARYEQILTIRRVDKVINVKIKIMPEILPEESVWKNYYACRFAWRDKMAEVRTGTQERFWQTSRDYFQAPYGIDIRSDSNLGITILANGYPFFHRGSGNKLDAVLIPKQESARTFEFGIGVDLEQPAVSAIDFIGPDPFRSENQPEPEKHFEQLFQLDADSVIPAAFDRSEDKKTVLLLLQETRGRSNKVTLTPHFKFQKAEILNSLDPITPIGTNQENNIEESNDFKGNNEAEAVRKNDADAKIADTINIPINKAEPSAEQSETNKEKIAESSNESKQSELENPEATVLKSTKAGSFVLEIYKYQLIPLRFTLE